MKFLSNTKNILLSSFIVLASSSALAGQLGPAGCGLGNMVMGKDSQVLAATTNGTGVQTFGITTGTSNCGPGVFSAQMVRFVESNQVALSDDASRGQGETISALASILGCSDTATLGSELKANYGEIFSQKEDSIAISKSIKSTVEKSRSLALTCQHVG